MRVPGGVPSTAPSVLPLPAHTLCRAHRVIGISPLSQLDSPQQGAYEGQHMPQRAEWQWVAAMSTEMGHERSEGSAVGRAGSWLLWGKQRTTVVVAQGAKAGQLLGEGLVHVLSMSRDSAGRYLMPSQEAQTS